VSSDFSPIRILSVDDHPLIRQVIAGLVATRADMNPIAQAANGREAIQQYQALPELENKRFRANADAKCDKRVNFRGMWGNVGMRRDTSVDVILIALVALFQGI
jgi:chemotaxis response regulator CheB